MFKELTDALADTIRQNPSGLYGVAGTVLGSITTFLLQRWQTRGKVTFTTREVDIYYSGSINEYGESESNRSFEATKNADRVDYSFLFRVTNPHPIPKSLTIESVLLCKTKPLFRHLFKSLVKPLLRDISYWKLSTS